MGKAHRTVAWKVSAGEGQKQPPSLVSDDIQGAWKGIQKIFPGKKVHRCVGGEQVSSRISQVQVKDQAAADAG